MSTKPRKEAHKSCSPTVKRSDSDYLCAPDMGHLNEEKEALLPPVQQTASQTLPVAVAVAEGSERKWDGSWLNCFGDCGEIGLSSFALAYFLPCVAFG